MMLSPFVKSLCDNKPALREIIVLLYFSGGGGGILVVKVTIKLTSVSCRQETITLISDKYGTTQPVGICSYLVIFSSLARPC